MTHLDPITKESENLLPFLKDLSYLKRTFCSAINPSGPDLARREKINLKTLKAFIKPFEAPQKSLKIKI